MPAKPSVTPALARILVPVCWTLLGVLTIAALVMFVMALTDRTHSPEASRGLGVMVAVFMLGLVAVMAVLLSVAVRRQSTIGLITMTLILVWPLVVLVGRPAVLAYNRHQLAAEEGRIGDFAHPALRAMTEAIVADDTLTLIRLLAGQQPPAGVDRAGNDLLAYAVVRVRDKQGSGAAVRALLDAGADPRRSRVSGTMDLVNFVVLGGSPASREAMSLLLKHGADPNAINPETGQTPIAALHDEPEMLRALVEAGADLDRVQPNGVTALVHFIATRQWESALYLIEKGANLDVRNADGLSVDYYLNEWKESVFGDHPEGWDQVRDAITARRVRK